MGEVTLKSIILKEEKGKEPSGYLSTYDSKTEQKTRIPITEPMSSTYSLEIKVDEWHTEELMLSIFNKVTAALKELNQ